MMTFCTLPIGESSHMGRCIISYQEVLRPVLKIVNHYEDEVINCNHRINGQFLKN
jgi:hypothetical protein